MSEVDSRAIAAFEKWLKSLADETRVLAEVVSDESVPRDVRSPLAGALNYLFKSLDLIDDGVEGLGFLDDAFVLRLASSKAQKAGPVPDAVATLADDAALIREFLGPLAGRLDKFVGGLEAGVVRGRSVDAILDDASVREEMLGDVLGWASRFEAPKFPMNDQALVKLRSFLGAKLPA